MSLAVLLSGQGAQGAAMFALTADLPDAAPVFDAAADLLGEDPRALVTREGAALHGNRTGQILCTTAALAGWRLIAPALRGRTVVAGYSIGDLAAWGVAGRMTAETTLRLAAARAEAMDQAAPDGHGLAGIRGLAADRIAGMAADRGLHVAIRNARDSVVVGGARDALEALCGGATAAGARRAVLLDVHVPSHTPVLAAATEALRGVFAAADLERPGPGAPRLIAGLDGAPVFSADEGLDKLARQVSETLDWAACLAACREAGATAVLELGPGHALARMAEAAETAPRVRALEDFASATGLHAWLDRAQDHAR